MSDLRIGIGTDRHRLEPHCPCILGGVTIECPVGPDGHSDGDAVLHALCDALLGAAGLEDLGTLFPDTDPKWEGQASSLFVTETLALLNQAHLWPTSVDMVVHCDQPKIGPYRDAIRKQIANLLSLPLDRINIKGKTTEGGDSTWIDVTAVALVGTSSQTDSNC
ncbi:MAG: 2-C-methyl-D-erythritol 2,4-cyclodiphosphate synthase [Planctomycetes bacterium]|nr:2-C-methyl-D-erythritol 2,4-cyclodiphosphate synthase [Planctomycetota bacterium]